MIVYNFMLKEYENEFYKVDKTPQNKLGLEPKANASKELIQSIYRFNVEAEDSSVCYDAEKLSQCMIEKFKASECYKQKTAKERKEIIKYLKDNPDVNEPGVDY